MFRTGLLVITSPLSGLSKGLPSILGAASQHVAETLYIQVSPDLSHVKTIPCTEEVISTVTSLYVKSSELCSKLDIRVLLHNFSRSTIPILSQSLNLHKPCDIVLTDYSVKQKETFANFLQSILPVEVPLKFITSEIEHSTTGELSNGPVDSPCASYDNVVLGGTFDRLHNGHKILLSKSLLLCNKKLTVGVTEGAMNARKTLCELILPTQQRIDELREFLTDIKPSLEYSLVPIIDPYGPSITDRDLQCIVVSEETLRGGNMVNDRRKEKGLSVLDIHVIEVVQDSHHSVEEEAKISSSSFRTRLLGTLLRPPQKSLPSIPQTEGGNTPYIIGLTGGIASGKSSICKRLKALGAGIIDCDKLGHAAYVRGTEAHHKIVSTFGEDIVDDFGEINRKALGAKVFGDKQNLEQLNKIVWPAIADLVRSSLKTLMEDGVRVVVLDAAVLLEAGWDDMANEVWTTIIPQQEAVRRLNERNNLSEEEALKRIKSQLSNSDRVNKSHVVLSTLWETSVTQKQVERAWSLLNKRLSTLETMASKI